MNSPTRREAVIGSLVALVGAGPTLARDSELGALSLAAPVVDNELRGLSMTGGDFWASGTKGTLVRGRGRKLEVVHVAGAETLDFRGVHAFDGGNVLAMSAGPGPASQLWRTRDGGKAWTQVFANTDPAGFWDAIVFVDRKRGFILGDPTGGRFTVLVTEDGGETWNRVAETAVPIAAAGEGAFAASNGCLAVGPKGEVAFCTGGAAWGRVYLSRDGGKMFNVLETPIPGGAETRGAFALAFGPDGDLWVCGGDYKAPNAATTNLAWLAAGGGGFQAIRSPNGYLSSIATAGDTVIATGLAGTLVSLDGLRFSRVSADPFNTVRLSGRKTAALVGPKGAIGQWKG
jgi:photosystem II stability/assembly factor-like uncharacterized protein